MEINFKPGVVINGISLKMLQGVCYAAEMYEILGLPFVVTSIMEGVHKEGSRHFSGNAIDIRTSNVPRKTWLKIVEELTDYLPKSFQIVLEIDHIHIEYDPK